MQDWFRRQPVAAQEELADLCQKLSALPRRRWRHPEFDPLEGEGGISEIRLENFRCSSGTKHYRLYGFFGPSEDEYTLLFGVAKRVRNDRTGKRIARERLARIQVKQATTHEFDFSARDTPTPAPGTGGKAKVFGFPPDKGTGSPDSKPSGQAGVESARACKDDRD